MIVLLDLLRLCKHLYIHVKYASALLLCWARYLAIYGALAAYEVLANAPGHLFIPVPYKHLSVV